MKTTREEVTEQANIHAQNAMDSAQYARESYIQNRSLSRRYRAREAMHRFCAKVLRRAAKTL